MTNASLLRQTLIDKFLEAPAAIPDIDIALGVAGDDVDIGELARIRARTAEGGNLLQALTVQDTHAHIMAVRDIEKSLLLVAGQRHTEGCAVIMMRRSRRHPGFLEEFS